MQTVTPSFTTASQGKVRKPISKAEISWTKTVPASVTFFTIGVSAIGGAHVIKGDDNDIAHYTNYHYEDETDYVESIEIDRFLEEPVMSVARAVADIVLDNNTDRFTPNGGSAIDDYIKVQRIIKLQLGFDYGTQELIQKFVGVNVDYPKLDVIGKRVALHALDFGYQLWDKQVKNTTMFSDTRSDLIIKQLLLDQGVPPEKLRIDAGINIIPFAYFYKGQNLGNIIAKICEAELGRFYVDEEGYFIFQSRDAWSRSPYNTSVLTIDKDMVIKEENPNDDNVINAVEVTGEPRRVGGLQLVWSQIAPIEIEAGSSVTFFVDYMDPMFSVETPGRLSNTSSFAAGYINDVNDDSASSYCEITTFTNFATSTKVTVTNNRTDVSIWLTKLDIFGRPAVKTGQIYGDAEDEDSIAEFGRHLVQINNDYIQDDAFATTLSQILVDDRKDISNYKRLTIRGLPQLQLGDRVTLESDGNQYNILRIRSKFTGPEGLTQQLTLVNRTIQTYFRIGISTIGGEDIISP